MTTPSGGSVTTAYGGSYVYSPNQTQNGQNNVLIEFGAVTSTSDPALAKNDTEVFISYASHVGLKYTDFGTWGLFNCASGTTSCLTGTNLIYAGTYGGAQPGSTLTALTSMPTTGYASYWGGATGSVSQPTSINSNGSASFYGNFGLTANFASNAIVGGINHIQLFQPNGTGGQNNIGGMNDIVFTATLSGNTFSGNNTVSADSNNPGAFDIAGATGSIIGGIYGPNANEAAGTFYMTGGAKSTSLVGSFGGAAGTLTKTASFLVDEVTLNGAIGTSLTATQDGISNGSVSTYSDTSLSGITKIITVSTPTGAITLLEGGDNNLNSSGSKFVNSAGTAPLLTNVVKGDISIINSTDGGISISGGGSFEQYGNAVGLSYSNFGVWDISPQSNNSSSQFPLYVGSDANGRGGGETTSMPTSGGATYTGNAVGYVVQNHQAGQFWGNASLTANFATGGGSISGTLSSINVYSVGNSGTLPSLLGTMNNLGFTNLPISGSEYSGAVSAQTGAGTAFNITGATGTLKGAFYGTAAPTPPETAGVFSLSGNGAEVVGSFGAKAPSDQRLKRDIMPAGMLSNGLKLYSWRYLGGNRRFTGVMAQDLLKSARFASAVDVDADGLMQVDYARIGYLPTDFEDMIIEGRQALTIWHASLH